MDRKVTIKFWKMVPAVVDGVDFSLSLAQAFKVKGDALCIELEGAQYQLTPQNDGADNLFLGDVIRLQNEALPSRLKRGEKAKKLSLGEGVYLGHHTAFIYDPKSQLLGFEVKPAAAGLVKLTSLVAALAKHTACDALPLLHKSEMNKLAGTKNGVLSFKIADPADLNTMDPELGNMRDNLVFLKEMVDGAYIHVAIGAGPRKEGLTTNRLLKTVGWLLGERAANRGKIQAVKVKQPHQAEQVLDFLKAHFKESDILALTGDPEIDWPLREALLRSALSKAVKHVKLNAN